MHQHTAQGIASLGRGDDKMLVHMSPREVQGLQSLAMAHGGSLTVNPQTGLPEAGFLDNILPMAASALGFYFGGPLGAAAASGLTTYAKTGNLAKGLFSGMTSYGLGSLTEGLSDVGAAEAAKENAIQQNLFI